jgi:hypothetical protein
MGAVEKINKLLEEKGVLNESKNKNILVKNGMVALYAPSMSNSKIREKIELLLNFDRDDEGKNGDHGYYLGDGPTIWRMSSVNSNIYVGSIKKMTDPKAKDIAKELLRNIKILNEEILNEDKTLNVINNIFNIDDYDLLVDIDDEIIKKIFGKNLDDFSDKAMDYISNMMIHKILLKEIKNVINREYTNIYKNVENVILKHKDKILRLDKIK